MLEQIIEPTLLTQFKEALENSGNVVVTCHKSPDGDAAGSNLALKLILDKLGKKATVVTPDNVPEDMAFLPGYDNIVSFAKDPEMAAETINAADLICCLDFNGLSRLADMRELVANAKCNKLMVDHHINPEPICNPILSYPQMASTCELLYRILVAIGYSDMIDLDVATCIYTGMMTDTGNFSYNSNHAELYIIVADLVRRGVDKDRIYKLTLGTSSEARMRLNCYAIAEKMRLFPSHKASLTILDKRDLRKFNYQVGDTEALANMPLAIPTVVWSVFFREERGFVKVSMRSEGDFHVNTLCAKYFNGGGHANAAGGEYHGPLRGAIDTFHQILRDLTENNVTI